MYTCTCNGDTDTQHVCMNVLHHTHTRTHAHTHTDTHTHTLVQYILDYPNSAVQPQWLYCLDN